MFLNNSYAIYNIECLPESFSNCKSDFMNCFYILKFYIMILLLIGIPIYFLPFFSQLPCPYQHEFFWLVHPNGLHWLPILVDGLLRFAGIVLPKTVTDLTGRLPFFENLNIPSKWQIPILTWNIKDSITSTVKFCALFWREKLIIYE